MRLMSPILFLYGIALFINTDKTSAIPFEREILRYEGECHVFLPCPTYGRASPAWKINETIYSISALQHKECYQPAFSGLTIVRVDAMLNKLTFQCLIPSGEKLGVIGGPISTLTVLESAENYSYSCSPFNQFQVGANIVFDARRIFFSNKTVTVAWKFVTPTCRPRTFQINVTNCSSDKILNTNYTNSQSITLPYSMLVTNSPSQGEIHSVTVRGYNCADSDCDCNYYSFAFEVESPEKVQTKIENVGIGRDACIDIPDQASSNRGSLHVLWPSTLNESDVRDCDCAIFSAGEFLLANCSDLRSSVYTLETITDVESGKYKMCFKNMSIAMNNTYVHLFYETSECEERALGFETINSYKRFFRSHVIILREVPNQPNVTINNDSEVCYSSTPSMPDAMIPNFEVLIKDQTKETVFQKTNLTSLADCVDVGAILKQDDDTCAPYEVTVKAHGQYITSKTTVFVQDNKTGSEVCTCIRDKRVNFIKYKPTEDADILTFDISCTTTFVSVLNLTLIVASDDDLNMTSYKRNFTCKRDEFINIDGLQRNTDYDYIIIWMSMKNDSCELVNETISTSSLKKRELLGYILARVIPFISIIAITIFIAIIIVIIIKKKKDKKDVYSFTSHNGSGTGEKVGSAPQEAQQEESQGPQDHVEARSD